MYNIYMLSVKIICYPSIPVNNKILFVNASVLSLWTPGATESQAWKLAVKLNFHSPVIWREKLEWELG